MRIKSVIQTAKKNCSGCRFIESPLVLPFHIIIPPKVLGHSFPLSSAPAETVSQVSCPDTIVASLEAVHCLVISTIQPLRDREFAVANLKSLDHEGHESNPRDPPEACHSLSLSDRPFALQLMKCKMQSISTC